MARVGSVAYKLALPPQAKIHPVIYVSQLKKHVPPSVPVSTDLDSVLHDSSVEVFPLALLERRYVAHAGAVAARVRVQWSGMSPFFATWEDESDLHRRFPSAPAWGQAGSKGGGNVMIRASG